VVTNDLNLTPQFYSFARCRCAQVGRPLFENVLKCLKTIFRVA